jgi:CRISPR-associated endonuclease/helicase Cas3
MADEIPTWRLFWAKTLPEDDEKRSEAKNTHPLWAHLLDVAGVAEVLWNDYLPASLRREMTHGAGAPSEQAAGRFLSFWIGLHDVGKALPFFQALHEPTQARLRERGLPLRRSEKPPHHGHASISLLTRWIGKREFDGKQTHLCRKLAAYAGFHHGRLRHRDKWFRAPPALGGSAWKPAQRALVDAVAEAWNPPRPADPSVERRRAPRWLLAFAGWTTLADWIGSMSAHFAEPLDARPADALSAYLPRSRGRAAEAVRTVGLHRPAALRDGAFADLFAHDEPRPIQARVPALDLSDEAPALTIIEAPTGEGKTEAALWLAARQQAGRPGGGLYVGMPSQATANGLYPRLADFLKAERAGGGHDDGESANLVLLHGNADLHPSRQLLDTPRPADVRDEDDETGDERTQRAEVRTRRWFLPKRRGLLAPYGIGTVDQTFLGVLFSKHFFVRLAGLAGKTVVFDEVHAYDTYMSELFVRLLRWLRALGANVVLLSATLPARTRRALVAAWTDDENGDGAPDDDHPGYPALTHVASGAVTTHDDFPAPDEDNKKRTALDWLPPALDGVAERIRQKTDAGATVIVIVNTVGRAQDLYETISDGKHALDLPAEDRFLLHARFPHGRRAEIEDAVLQRFGTNRPVRPGVLVATQIAEQSLDLDADYMLSDLAPVDLLLQREGRLHRHARERPDRCEQPELCVLCPEPPAADAFPDVSDVGFVYDDLLLLNTWHLLHRPAYAGGWTLPDDYRPLVDGVYDRDPPLELTDRQRATWDDAEKEYQKRRDDERAEARNRLIPRPDHLRNLPNHNPLTLADEDEEDAHPSMRALTRLGGPSVEVVCLHRGPDGALFTDSAREHLAPGGSALSTEETRQLLNAAVRISPRRAVGALTAFWDEHSNPAWERITEHNAALHRHRCLIFEDRCWSHGALTLRLDDALGLVVEWG